MCETKTVLVCAHANHGSLRIEDPPERDLDLHDSLHVSLRTHIYLEGPWNQ